MALLPDFGTYLLDNQLDKPFILRAYNGLFLGQDLVLGWVINGQTSLSAVSSFNSHPVPNINQNYLFSIYLGRGSKTRAEKILSRLKTEGLPIVPRGDKKYLVPSGKEWVVPLQYLK